MNESQGGDMQGMPTALVDLLQPVARGRVVVLTGAGVSAESGIPTFRGSEGFWSVGSQVYTPQEMATQAFFARDPDAVWSWYLYRRSLCNRAEPNAAHRALVRLERTLGERFVLVTQNVDGLHRRAGSRPERTYEIHGNLHRMRCTARCRMEPDAVPEAIGDWPRLATLGARERSLLRCPRCGSLARPHVLWFDETYDERHYHSESAMAALLQADWLLVIGTSWATSLPALMGELAIRRGMPLVYVDPVVSSFVAAAGERSFQLCGPAALHVPPLVDWIEAQQEATRGA